MSKFQDTDFGDRILHLSFNYHLGMSWEIPRDMLKAKQLRTFLLAEEFRDGSELNRKVLQQLVSNFKCLRVLDLSDLAIRTLPKSIGKLIHLRYLNLSNNPIRKLPNSITKLINMQTLILNSCADLIALPIDTRKLTNLRTLDVWGCSDLNYMPPGLGELTSLHKLPYFIVNSREPNLLWNPATSKLSDLKTLNNLSGFLEICLNEELDDFVSEAEEAELNAKHGLTSLIIEMNNTSYCSGSSNNDEAVLEGLKPPQNLKKFEIGGYNGHNLPSWAMGDSLCMTLPNLVDIRLVTFYECGQVPCFSQLPFLKRLILEHLRGVEYMENSVDEVESPSTRTFFPSLQELKLWGMDNLKGWWEETKVVDCSDEGTISDTSAQGHSLPPSFSALIKLQIRHCPRLVAFPLCPSVEELDVANVNKELTILKKVTNFGEKGDVGSSEYTSNLKIMTINDVEILGSLRVECLAQLTSLEISYSKLKNTSELDEVFKHLSSLTSLRFSYCNNLTSISVGMEHLVSLETLIISWCRELDMPEKRGIEDGMPWKALITLRTLEVHGLDKLEHLPSGIQHLTNLRCLVIFLMDNLEEVPEWIGCLSSLRSMQIGECNRLRCLPEGVTKLTSLNELSIDNCVKLTKRCRGPNGADWPYIRHIPFVVVCDDRWKTSMITEFSELSSIMFTNTQLRL